MEPTIKFLRLNPKEDKDINLPKYMTPLSAGMDISAAIKTSLTLKPQDIALIPTGFAMTMPQGFEAQIRPRSGLAVKHGITIINSPGTIDADYRGEVKIGIINLGKKEFTIRRGDRIAQMVIKKAYHANIEETTQLDATKRNSGGFGHTGV